MLKIILVGVVLIVSMPNSALPISELMPTYKTKTSKNGIYIILVLVNPLSPHKMIIKQITVKT